MLGPKFPRLNKKKVEFAFFKNISPTLVLSGSPCSSIDLRGSPNYIYIYISICWLVEGRARITNISCTK